MEGWVYIVIENGWIGDRDLLPEEIIVNKYFLKEKEEIESLEADRDEILSKKGEFEEENSGEEGVLEDHKNDKGSINKNSIKNRIKEIKGNLEFEEEFIALSEYMDIIDKESTTNKKIKEAGKTLEKLADEKYESLSTSEVKDLAINHKWIPSIVGEVNSELDNISNRLTTRIKELAERYDETLGKIEEEVESYSSKVEEHLKRMGFTW